jgi:hypothetical protein
VSKRMSRVGRGCVTFDGYLLGFSVCRPKLRGDVRGLVLIRCFNKINSSHHCKEQDSKMCAVQLETKAC